MLADLKPLNLPPPHWHPAICAIVPWADFIPSFNEFPEAFKVAIPNIIASVVWHHVALSERLPKSNPLHGSPLWTTHRFWIDRLFPLLIGGTTGTSLLTPSGRNILTEVADDLHVMMQREMRMCCPSQVPIEFSAKLISQIQDIVLAAVGSHATMQSQEKANHTYPAARFSLTLNEKRILCLRHVSIHVVVCIRVLILTLNRNRSNSFSRVSWTVLQMKLRKRHESAAHNP